MESRLAREAEAALLDTMRRMSPEQRLDVFLEHCQLVRELDHAGRPASMPMRSSPSAGRKLKELASEFSASGFQTELRVGDLDDPIPALLGIGDWHGNRVQIADRYADIVGLSGFEDSYPHELSGGITSCRTSSRRSDTRLC